MYDFDREVDRRNTGSLKWDVKDNELPMWVADMDFSTAPEVTEAIQKKAAQGIYGYNIVTEEWYRAYMDWWNVRHRLKVEKEWLIFATGVVPIISSCVRKLTTPNENVVLQTPVYNIFFNSIINNGRNALENPLLYQDGKYRMDFEDLEEKLADPQTTLLLLCNPQNPVGILWDSKTLQRVGELCAKYHVTVISDEIHCDLTAPGKEYNPFSGVSELCREISITCISPTKAFNLAGLQTAAAMVPNEALRHKVWRALNTDEVAEPNVFAADAAVAAFTRGAAWLDELRDYLQINRQTVVDYLARELPELHVVSTEVTYLLWLDCSRLTSDSKKLAEEIRRVTGLFLSEGSEYGGDGSRFLRMNVACSRRLLQDGLERLKEGIRAFEKLH